MLADLNTLCPLVVARLTLITGFDVENLVSAATGTLGESQTLRAVVNRTMHAEKTLLEKNQGGGPDPFPARFFETTIERNDLRERIKDYDSGQGSLFLLEEEVER